MSPLFKHHISGQVATTSQQKSLFPGLFPEHVASVNTLTFCTALNHSSVSAAASSDVTPPPLHPQVRPSLSLKLSQLE